MPIIEYSFRIFEPRYKKLLKDVNQNGEQVFGMCWPQNNEDGVSNIGVLLKIVQNKILGDGTSLIRVQGCGRFQVNEWFEKGENRQNYPFANVTIFDDNAPGPNVTVEASALLSQTIRASIERIFDTMVDLYPQSISRITILRMIEDPIVTRRFFQQLDSGNIDLTTHNMRSLIQLKEKDADLVWWVLHVLGAPSQLGAEFLRNRSLNNRMRAVERLLLRTEEALEQRNQRKMEEKNNNNSNSGGGEEDEIID